jgi:hypothetical protein
MADAAPSAAPAAPTPSAAPVAEGQSRGPDGKFTPGAPTDGKAPVPAGETAAERRIRIALEEGGQEEEVPESTLRAWAKRGRNAAQLVSKADKARQDAARASQEAEAKLARLKDPKEFFRLAKELGHDPRALAEEEVLRAIEEERLTPEQRRIREVERQLAERDEKDRRAKEEADNAALEAETETHRNSFADLFMGTMERLGLPKKAGRAVVHRMADVYLQAQQVGMTVSEDDMAAHVLEGLRAEQSAVVKGMSPAEIVEWLGPDTMAAVRKYDLEQYRAKRKGGQPAQVRAPSGAPPPPDPKTLDPRKGRMAYVDALLKGKI